MMCQEGTPFNDNEDMIETIEVKKRFVGQTYKNDFIKYLKRELAKNPQTPVICPHLFRILESIQYGVVRYPENSLICLAKIEIGGHVAEGVRCDFKDENELTASSCELRLGLPQRFD